MKEDARRDLVPAIIVFLVCLIGKGLSNWMTMVSLLPLICYALYFMGIIKPKEVYDPKPAKSDSFWKSMYNYPHPIIMPKVLYAMLGVVYLLIGIALFLIFPVSFYFLNWANMAFKMSSSSTATIELNPGQEYRSSNHRYQDSTVQDAHFRPARPSKPDHIPSYTSTPKPPKPQGTMNSQASSDPTLDAQAQKEKMARMAQKKTIEQIEKNNEELVDIQQNTAHALDTMFGDSKITKAKFQNGFDSAVEMSRQNLEVAKEYVKSGGQNPEVLQKFLNRSQTINSKTGELLDALVTHQQNQMEDNLNNLTDSLDELQESIKYYQ